MLVVFQDLTRSYAEIALKNLDDLLLLEATVPNVWFVETVSDAQELGATFNLSDNIFGVHTASLLGASVFDFTLYGNMSNLENNTGMLINCHRAYE